DRHNLIITRSPEEFQKKPQMIQTQHAGEKEEEEEEEGDDSVVVITAAATSIASALQKLQLQQQQQQQQQQQHGGGAAERRLGRVFVIGGAEIYKQALRMRECERVLWTRLSGEWECDTWFPEGVVKDGVDEGGEGKNGWRRRTTREMEEWIGEEGFGGLRSENGVEFEVSMWERERERDGG
ncbi:MAG: hypothetical protein LQ341_005103, partial [Variospora aurantia]